MHFTWKKQSILMVAALTMASQAQATTTNHFARVGKKKATPNGLFTNFVVHPLAAQLVEDMPDSVLCEFGSAKVEAHELWELLMMVIVEVLNEKLLGSSNAEAQDIAKLTVYGAVLHKMFEEGFCAAGLHKNIDKKIKKAYKQFGSGYFQAVLAGFLDEFFNPEKYSKVK